MDALKKWLITTPNHHPYSPKMDVLPKTFLKIILPAFWLVRQVLLYITAHIPIQCATLWQSTLLEKFWRISLYMTDDAISKLYVTKSEIEGTSTYSTYIQYTRTFVCNN